MLTILLCEAENISSFGKFIDESMNYGNEISRL